MNVPNDPVAIVAGVLGVLLAGPVLWAVVRSIYFLAAITTKVDATASAMSVLNDEMKEFRHTLGNMIQQHELEITLLRSDVDRIDGKE